MSHAKDRMLVRAKIGLASALARLQNVKRHLRDCMCLNAPAAPQSDPPALLEPPPKCAGRTHFINDHQIVECSECPR